MTITAEQAAKLLEGIDSQVISAAYDLGPNGKLNPLWVFVDCGQNAMRFGRWARGMKNPAPYVRLDLALDALIASEAARKLAEERLAKAVQGLKHYREMLCEGFCGENLWADEGHSHPEIQMDCGGCLAASVLLKVTNEEIDNG